MWFRVNEQLPVGLQKSLPDRPPEMQSAGANEGVSQPVNRSPPMPQRSPPPPPSSQPSVTSGVGGGGGQLGAFWSTQHAKDSLIPEDKNRPKFDEEPSSHGSSRHDRSRPDNHPLPRNASPPVKEENIQTHAIRKNVHSKTLKPDDGLSKDFKISFFQKDTDTGIERPKAPKSDSTTTFQDEAFNTFVAEFDTNKLSSRSSNAKSVNEEALEDEIERLKEQLKQANLEKAEITSKFEKLSAICRSQRQEIQDLKQAVAARSPSPNKDASRNQISPGNQPAAMPQSEKIEGTVWELQQGKSDWSTPSPEPKSWQAFPEEHKPHRQSTVHSVRTRNGHLNKQAAQPTSSFDTWGFGTESFTAVPAASSQRLKNVAEGSSSQGVGQSKVTENPSSAQPAGWAGF